MNLRFRWKGRVVADPIPDAEPLNGILVNAGTQAAMGYSIALASASLP
jgi:hypothetical protein